MAETSEEQAAREAQTAQTDATNQYNVQQWQMRMDQLEMQCQQLVGAAAAYQTQAGELRTLLQTIAGQLHIDLATVKPAPPADAGQTPTAVEGVQQPPPGPVAPTPAPPMPTPSATAPRGTAPPLRTGTTSDPDAAHPADKPSDKPPDKPEEPPRSGGRRPGS